MRGDNTSSDRGRRLEAGRTRLVAWRWILAHPLKSLAIRRFFNEADRKIEELR